MGWAASPRPRYPPAGDAPSGCWLKGHLHSAFPCGRCFSRGGRWVPRISRGRQQSRQSSQRQGWSRHGISPSSACWRLVDSDLRASQEHPGNNLVHLIFWAVVLTPFLSLQTCPLSSMITSNFVGHGPWGVGQGTYLFSLPSWTSSKSFAFFLAGSGFLKISVYYRQVIIIYSLCKIIKIYDLLKP